MQVHLLKQAIYNGLISTLFDKLLCQVNSCLYLIHSQLLKQNVPYLTAEQAKLIIGLSNGYLIDIRIPALSQAEKNCMWGEYSLCFSCLTWDLV